MAPPRMAFAGTTSRGSRQPALKDLRMGTGVLGAPEAESPEMGREDALEPVLRTVLLRTGVLAGEKNDWEKLDDRRGGEATLAAPEGPVGVGTGGGFGCVPTSVSLPDGVRPTARTTSSGEVSAKTRCSLLSRGHDIRWVDACACPHVIQPRVGNRIRVLA